MIDEFYTGYKIDGCPICDSSPEPCVCNKPKKEQTVEVPLSLLKEVEWGSYKIEEGWKTYSCCPVCRNLQEQGHTPTCRLGKAIGGS